MTHGGAAAWAIPLVWLVLSAPERMALAVGCYLVYASSITFSRIYLGVHSLLDVTGGALLGEVASVLARLASCLVSCLVLSARLASCLVLSYHHFPLLSCLVHVSLLFCVFYFPAR